MLTVGPSSSIKKNTFSLFSVTQLLLKIQLKLRKENKIKKMVIKIWQASLTPEDHCEVFCQKPEMQSSQVFLIIFPYSKRKPRKKDIPRKPGIFADVDFYESYRTQRRIFQRKFSEVLKSDNQ